MNKGFSIAIDGPVASGKGTLAISLSDILGGFSINTGAMYRAVALFCIENNIDYENEENVIKVLPEISVKLTKDKVYLNENDITERLKEPDVSSASSIVAAYSGVRKDLAERQRKIAKQAIEEGRIVIAEGRDIAIRVIPDADIKIFLTAKQEIRAKRRVDQYRERGIQKSLDEMLEDVRVRDERDINRSVDPLPSDPASLGYFVLDNSSQTENETIETVMNELKRKGLIND